MFLFLPSLNYGSKQDFLGAQVGCAILSCHPFSTHNSLPLCCIHFARPSWFVWPLNTCLVPSCPAAPTPDKMESAWVLFSPH